MLIHSDISLCLKMLFLRWRSIQSESLSFSEKSPDFDVMLKKDKSIVCSTEVVTEELSEITMCVWFSIVHGDAVILNMMYDR